MEIKCNYDDRIGCTLCNQSDCLLLEPCTASLLNIQREIEYKLQRKQLLENGIVILKQNIRALKLGMISQDIISVNDCEDMLNMNYLEKRQLVSEIRELRKREKNIMLVLKRRMEQ